MFIQKYRLFNVIAFAVNAAYKTDDFYCGLKVSETESLDKVIDKENDLLFVAMQWNRLNSERRNIQGDHDNGNYNAGRRR